MLMLNISTVCHENVIFRCIQLLVDFEICLISVLDFLLTSSFSWATTGRSNPGLFIIFQVAITDGSLAML